MRVLDVVGGILARLLDGELEVKVERAVGPALEEEPPRDVGADPVEDVLELDELTVPLRHPEDLPLVEEAHELVDDDVPPFEQAERLQSRAHAEHVAVRVRAPDVDLPVEPAVRERLAVVREVHTEIGGRTGRVRADEDRVDVLAQVAALEPHRAVAVLDDLEPAKLGDGRAEVVASRELALAIPDVESHAELLRG